MQTPPDSERDSDALAEVSRTATGIVAPSPEESVSPPVLTLESPELYFNRELSLLEFQKRVLAQAQDPENLLLERVKFLSIVSSNLDEFFMVRVAGLQRQAASGVQEASADGLPAAIQLQLIREQVRRLVEEMQNLLRDTLLPALETEGIRISDFAALPPEEQAALNSYFLQNVFPVLTPLAFDPGRPFPHISSGSLNLAVVVGDSQGIENFARIKAARYASPPSSGSFPDTPGEITEIAEVRTGVRVVGAANYCEPATAFPGNGDRGSASFSGNPRCRSRYSGTGER